MQILLTGGTGSVGREVVNQLSQQGHSIRVIGRRNDITLENAEYFPCDIGNFQHLREIIRGCEAVVHLAALPNPGKGTPEEIFQANCQGTFHVFQAAAEEGIKKIIQASSINAAGQYYGSTPAPLQYLPLDEDHPVYSTDAYSFSKNIVEEIGNYFWRREAISSLAFRLPWVAPAETHSMLAGRRERIQRITSQLQDMATSDRKVWFEQAWDYYNAFRAKRPYEKPGYATQLMNEMLEQQRDMIYAMSSRVNFFTMLDERDSALAILQGLKTNFTGSHALFINDKQNWTGIPSQCLVDLFYPDVQVKKKEFKNYDSLVSIKRAREYIQFEPQYSFGSE